MASIIDDWKNVLPKITDPVTADKYKQITIWACITAVSVAILFIIKQQLNKKK